MSTAGSYQICNVVPVYQAIFGSLWKCWSVNWWEQNHTSDTAFIYFGDCSNTASVISYQMSDSEAWPDSSWLLSSSQRHSDEDSSPSAKNQDEFHPEHSGCIFSARPQLRAMPGEREQDLSQRGGAVRISVLDLCCWGNTHRQPRHQFRRVCGPMCRVDSWSCR